MNVGFTLNATALVYIFFTFMSFTKTRSKLRKYFHSETVPL